MSARTAPAGRDGGVAFLLRSLNFGGAERQLVTLAVGLHRRGRRVAVLVFYEGGPLEAELRRAGVPVRVIGKTGRWDVGGFARRLLGAIRAEAPAVLHSYLDVPNVVAASLKPLLPGVRVVWGVRASNMDLRRYDRFSRGTFALLRSLSRVPELIIANSRAGAEYHSARGFPAERTVVIPNGIDTRRFRPDAEARARLRAAWGVEPGEAMVGIVGRLDPMKDHPTFLEAAARLARERPAVRFVCVGDGPAEYRASLERRARELGIAGRVVWARAGVDVEGVYSALDVLCSASSYGEGFPNVVGEAMACGTPCAVTDVGDSALVVGAEGRVVPPGDPVALAHALGALLAERRWPRAAAREWIRGRFSVERLIESTESTLWQQG